MDGTELLDQLDLKETSVNKDKLDSSDPPELLDPLDLKDLKD